MTAPSRDEESSAACKRENSCDDSARKLADSPRRASVLFILYLALSFIGGLLAGFALCFALRSAYRPCGSPGPAQARLAARPPPTIPGSKTSHIHPPPSPTNALPFLFPTNVGYAGATPTGAEPGLLATAPSYPIHTGAPQLVTEPVLGESDDDFDIFRHWGNLSPWFSVGSFGLDTTPDAPDGCTVTGLHFLHRHGARYPTMDETSGPLGFANKLVNATLGGRSWTASGSLEFLNDWTYKLGGELLTPFGRQQLCTSSRIHQEKANLLWSTPEQA